MGYTGNVKQGEVDMKRVISKALALLAAVMMFGVVGGGCTDEDPFADPTKIIIFFSIESADGTVILEFPYSEKNNEENRKITIPCNGMNHWLRLPIAKKDNVQIGVAHPQTLLKWDDYDSFDSYGAKTIREVGLYRQTFKFYKREIVDKDYWGWVTFEIEIVPKIREA